MDKNRPVIMVVDDDSKLRKLLSRYLIENNFFVLTAANGKEALEKFSKFKFDLLILDIMMPVMNGIELAKAIRQKSNILIIMLSAMGEPQNRIDGLTVGADDYIAKPFEPKEILLRINRLIGRAMPESLRPKNIVDFGNFQFDLEALRLTQNNQNIELSSTESKMLKFLIQNAGKPIAREEFIKELGSINERSVDVQIIRLRNKIEQDSKNPYFLRTIRGEGYAFYY